MRGTGTIRTVVALLAVLTLTGCGNAKKGQLTERSVVSSQSISPTHLSLDTTTAKISHDDYTTVFAKAYPKADFFVQDTRKKTVLKGTVPKNGTFLIELNKVGNYFVHTQYAGKKSKTIKLAVLSKIQPTDISLDSTNEKSYNDQFATVVATAYPGARLIVIDDNGNTVLKGTVKGDGNFLIELQKPGKYRVHTEFNKEKSKQITFTIRNGEAELARERSQSEASSKSAAASAESESKAAAASSKATAESKSKAAAAAARAKAESESRAKAAEEAARQQEAQSWNTGITYDQIARNPDAYAGKKVTFTGKVVDLISDDGEARIAINGDYDQIIYLVWNSDEVKGRILENDKITFRGFSRGLLTYKSVLGKKITIPSIKAAAIQNSGKAPDDYGY